MISVKARLVTKLKIKDKVVFKEITHTGVYYKGIRNTLSLFFFLKKENAIVALLLTQYGPIANNS